MELARADGDRPRRFAREQLEAELAKVEERAARKLEEKAPPKSESGTKPRPQ